MKKLTKANLLADLLKLNAPVAITIDGLNSPLFVKKITVAEQIKLYNFAKNNDNPHEAMLQMVAVSVCDQDGERIFGDDDLDDLRQIDTAVITQLIEQASAINNIDKDEAVDDAEKN